MKAEKAGGASAARRQFGNETWFRETCRELWSLGRIEIWWQDIRYGARLLRRSPVLTAVAVLSLGLGIGANTAIFSMLNAILIKSLPVEKPEQLRVLSWVGTNASMPNFSGSINATETGQRSSGSFPFPMYRDFRDHARGFSEVFR